MSAAQYVGIGIIAGYWVVLITTRWMFIARPNRRFTLARIDDAQYFLEPHGEPSLLDEARAVATGTQMVDDPAWLRASPRPGAAARTSTSCGRSSAGSTRVVGAADLERLARPRRLEPPAPRRGAARRHR